MPAGSTSSARDAPGLSTGSHRLLPASHPPTQVEAECVLPRQRVLVQQRLGVAAASVTQHEQAVPAAALLCRQAGHQVA